MKSVNVHYFAFLREKAGKDSEEVFFDGSYKDLYLYLSNRYDFELPVEMIQLAVNDEFMPISSDITLGAKVVFIPPMAGG